MTPDKEQTMGDEWTDEEWETWLLRYGESWLYETPWEPEDLREKIMDQVRRLRRGGEGRHKWVHTEQAYGGGWIKGVCSCGVKKEWRYGNDVPVCPRLSDPTPTSEKEPRIKMKGGLRYGDDPTAIDSIEVADPHTRAEGEEPTLTWTQALNRAVVALENLDRLASDSYAGGPLNEVAAQMIRDRLRTDPDEGSENREPVAWRYREVGDEKWHHYTEDPVLIERLQEDTGHEVQPLYAPKEEGDG